jgi:hypothetical protein
MVLRQLFYRMFIPRACGGFACRGLIICYKLFYAVSVQALFLVLINRFQQEYRRP